LSGETAPNSNSYSKEDLSGGTPNDQKGRQQDQYGSDQFAGLPLISARELVDYAGREPIQWLIEELIPAGSVVMLAGLPGTYKTWFALCLAQAVAEGKPFLSRSVDSGVVSYVDRENPKALLEDRLQRIGLSDNLFLWPLWVDPEPPPLIGRRHVYYQRLAKASTLLVFDSFRKFHGQDENSSTEMAPVMEQLRSLTKNGATVLILHHSGKNSLYRGSTEISAGVDVAFCIEKGKETDKFVRLKFECLKHRFIKEPILDLEFAINGEGRAIFSDMTSDPAKEKLGKVWGVICRLKRDKGMLPNQSQIVEAMKDQNIGKDATLGLLQQGEGKLWKSESEGSGKPTRYKPFFPPRWLIPK